MAEARIYQVDAAGGAVLNHSLWPDGAEPPAPPDGILFFMSDDSALAAAEPGSLVATIESGVVQSIAQAPEPACVYLHVTAADAQSNDPPRIQNNGADALTVTATLRYGRDTSSSIVENASGDWRIVIRDADGRLYDMIQVNCSGGVAHFNYTTNGKPAECTLDERDFDPIAVGGQTYQVLLESTPVFNVFRML